MNRLLVSLRLLWRSWCRFWVDWDPDGRLADYGTNDEPHLDPNGCNCDGCKEALAVIHEVIRQEAITQADFDLWRLELGFVQGGTE